MSIIGGISRIRLTNFDQMKKQKKNSRNFAEEHFDLDKSWDIISYILVGKQGFRENNILSEVIYPAENYIIYEDENYTEYVNYSSPNRVKEIYDSLKLIKESRLMDLLEKSDFDKKPPYHIYGGWTKTEKDLQSLLNFFLGIKKIYKHATENNNYISVSIN